MLINEEEYFRGQVEGDVVYGIQGPEGPAGPTGKNAYQYAAENGYTGSEEKFGHLMGQLENLVDNPGSGGNVDVTIDGETLVIAENSTATIDGETLIL